MSKLETLVQELGVVGDEIVLYPLDDDPIPTDITVKEILEHIESTEKHFYRDEILILKRDPERKIISFLVPGSSGFPFDTDTLKKYLEEYV